MAMSCHRMMDTATIMGLPEVNQAKKAAIHRSSTIFLSGYCKLRKFKAM
jgi:hypothetical protein